MEMEFMVYNLVFVMKMSVYTIWLVLPKGRASAISFYGWWVSSGRRESETLGSLWITHSKKQTSPKPIIYVDIWIYDCWSAVNPITVHEPIVSLASPRFRALPPTTVIIIIQSNRYCSHIKPRLILYSNESCHTSRADTICAVNL